MSESRKRYTGTFFRYVSSYDGVARFEASLSRKTRKSTLEYLQIEVELSRSDLGCMVRGLKAFADKEREQTRDMPI